MISSAGLSGTFRGGYVSVLELDWLNEYGERALADNRLGDEHRQFIREIELDARGYPMWRGKYAGIGGVYTISKN
jgi:hypothetical protein